MSGVASIAPVLERIAAIRTQISAGRQAPTVVRTDASGSEFSELLAQSTDQLAGTAAAPTATGSTSSAFTAGPVGIPTATWVGAPPNFGSSSTAFGAPTPAGTSAVSAPSGPIDVSGLPADASEPVPAATPFAGLFEAAGQRHGVPPRLLAALGWVESRYQTDAVSPVGARGVMQFMPATAREYEVDPTDPASSIDGAARLLSDLEERFGSWDLAMAAYNAGPGTISRNGNQPTPGAAEYVARIRERMEQM